MDRANRNGGAARRSKNGMARAPSRGSVEARVRKLNAKQEQVRAALEKTYRDLCSVKHRASLRERTHDFAFHMMDWNTDLMRLADLYADPEGRSEDEWVNGVMGFLYHAIGHLLAAAELLDGEVKWDPFNVIRTQNAKRKRLVPTAGK